MSKVDIEEIDFNDKRHKLLIMTLSKKNNFHVDTLYISIMKKLPEIYSSLSTKNKEDFMLYLKKTKAFYAEDNNYKGYIILINKKAIGFILYFTNDVYDVIKYLLIDKEYQLKGYGKTLMKYFIINSNKQFIKINEDDIEKDSYKFYDKIGFKSNLILSILFQNENNLYYIK